MYSEQSTWHQVLTASNLVSKPWLTYSSDNTKASSREASGGRGRRVNVTGLVTSDPSPNPRRSAKSRVSARPGWEVKGLFVVDYDVYDAAGALYRMLRKFIKNAGDVLKILCAGFMLYEQRDAFRPSTR